MQSKGSVLIADGEPTIADLLVELLTEAGYAALTASDGASTFWIIINYAPALLLLDMELPDIGAPDLIAQLRGAGVAAMPIVLMSTELGEIKPHVPGVSMCLAKPFDIGNLLTCIATYVQPGDAEAAFSA